MKIAYINNVAHEILEGETILQFVNRINGKKSIPTLCDAPNLDPFGSCRVCSVDVSLSQDGPPKSMASCHTPVMANSYIYPDSDRILKLRKNIVELVLTDHPLDCLTCEVNNNCELQDVAALVGIRDVRYPEGKNHLDRKKDKSHPYMVSDFSKCINCFRCVRACDEVQGQFVLSMAGRGFDAHIVKGQETSFALSDCVSCGACAIVEDQYHVGLFGTPVLTEAFPGIQSYYGLLAEVLKSSPEAHLETLRISGLRGRGGAGFPISFKLESAKNTPSKTKFIVCNADEGDPGAYSDRYLLEQRPHAVLLGMMIAGYIMGADMGVLYIRAEYPEAIDITQKAIDEITNLGYLGKNILGTSFKFNFKIIRAQGAYICGEETALLSSIEGQRPEVRVRPPYPTQQGLFNQPTVVNNVETLACIPFVIKNGGQAFANLGKGKSTGTKLVSLDGFFNRPGIYEVDMGTPLSVVIHELGLGFKEPIKALHIGGPLGGLVPVHKIEDLSVDFESFSQNGFLLGHASIVCLPESYPIIEYIRHLFQFTAHESCGKCFPCRLGSTRGFELIDKAMKEDYQIEMELFEDLINTMEMASLCALGGGLPLPIKNALKYFEPELKPYFSK